MAATSEPRTLEEMHARVLRARANGAAAARRHEEAKRAPVAEEPTAQGDCSETRPAPDLSPRQIIARVAAEHGLSASQVVGSSLKRPVVAARFAAISAVEAAHPHLSLAQIGRHFGGRDHTTILSALRRVDTAQTAMPSDGLLSSAGLSLGERSPEQILREVAGAYGTTVRHLRGRKRARGLHAPRRVAVIAIRAAHPRLSCAAIGLVVNREESAVRTALLRHEKRRAAAEVSAAHGTGGMSLPQARVRRARAVGDRPISSNDIRVLTNALREAPAISATACAHLTAMLVAPVGSFVTIAPISGDMRVCVGRKPITGHDDVWVDWPAWQARWATGPLDAAFALLDHALPGVNFLYGRGRTRAGEPPYGCKILFGWDEVLGEAEHEDGPSAVILALLATLLARTTPANIDSLPEKA